MANIIGTNGNDSLMGSGIGGFPELHNDTLTGGGGNDTFYDLNLFPSTSTITDFGGVGKGTNPTAAVIAEVDTLKFDNKNDPDYTEGIYTPENLLLTQNGSNLEITFAGILFSKVILQNFALENLDNLSKSTGATVDLGNILFYGQTTITDSFDVFNANSTQTTIFNKNTVTFLNDLNNNVKGFENSNDVINGEGGDDIIDGLSGNDLLRGGAGNNTLNGGTGDDTLQVDSPSGNNLLNGGDGNDFLRAGSNYYNYYFGEEDDRSLGNNILNGGAGNDTLSSSGSLGDNLFNGGDGNDFLSISGGSASNDFGSNDSRSLGNNTLNGGAGNDTLSASSSTGDNLLNGGDGNDSLNISGLYEFFVDQSSDSGSSGNNTLNGGAGDDTLSASGSKGNNLLNGGDGNDFLDISGLLDYSSGYSDSRSSGNNTLNGGAGDDTLSATGSTGYNLLDGGDGNDSIYVGSQSFVLDLPAPFSLVTQVDGGKGDDLLSVNYSAATAGITSTFNATTNIGSITAGKNRVNYKNIERLNILGTAYNDNIVGNSENDTLSTGSAGKDTIDGGEGDDVLSVDYSGATGGVTSTFNATTNIGSITAGTSSVSYKNIERFNISGTAYNDNIVGEDGNDTLSTGSAGKDTIDGGEGDDLLSVDYSAATGGITSTFNATTNIGSITAGANRVNYKNIERLNISGTGYNDQIVGNSGNDRLSGGYGGNDTLTGGAGNDTFVYISYYYNGSFYSGGTDTITDFGGVGKGSNPSATVINSLDTLQFTGQFTDSLFTAQNLQLTQNGNNLEITFGNVANGKVILQDFKLENLDNLPANSSRPAVGNILFYGQTSITDSFDVFDADSTQSNLFNKNTVTFLNDLNNNIIGFDNSNDVINGQGGDDIINGLSGNDILRANDGNDTLIGGAGNDTLESSVGNNTLDGGTGNDNLSISSSTGNNTLNGGTGDDNLSVSGSKGDNLLSGGDGNDYVSLYDVYLNNVNTNFLGNNTLEGGAGNDRLSISSSTGNNLLSGGDGNDYLDISNANQASDSSGNNTLEGGSGDDTLTVDYGSTGNNLVFGGDGNDTLSISGSTGNNLVFGGDGNDTLTVGSDSRGDNLLDGGDGNDSIYIQSYRFSASTLVTQTVDGGNGDDYLLVDYSINATKGITTTFNPTTNISSITNGTNRVNYKNIERLNISGTVYDDNIVGGNGNDTLSGGDRGKDTIDGGKGDDVLSVNYSSATIDGGEGDDLLSVNYSSATNGITTTFNPTTNIGSITAGTNQVNYKNIEELNISGTVYDDNIVGGNGNDTLSGGDSGKDTIDGGKGDNVLSVNYSSATVGITSTFNPTTNIGSITAGTNQVSYKNIERLNISGTAHNDNIVGGNGNDTLSGGGGNDTLTGGAGNDTFVYSYGSAYTITDFGGVGKDSNPSVEVINSLDTLQFTSDGYTAQNLQLTQNGNNLEITFESDYGNNTKVILQNFKLENLNNLPANSSRPAIGNILFSGDSSVTDSFDVFDANSTQTNLFNKNTVTFLNDLNNNITGFDNFNDVINGQGGDDIINGLSGNDILRGDAGNDTLIGGVGNDTLEGGEGNNILNGGTGDDRLSADDSRGDNILNGGVGDDRLSANDSRGDNTLNGGTGDDTLSANKSRGDNLLSGGDGNDSLDISTNYNLSPALGNNTLKGGAGNDTLNAQDSKGDNFLSGGDGNDILTGGNGNDTLYGGNGTDTFAFYDYKGGVDTIYDFNATNELIQVLSYSSLSEGLSTGLLQKSQFTIGTSATTSEERFIYNSATGALYFDKDGSATGFSQVQFAQLSTGLSLTNNNFVVG